MSGRLRVGKSFVDLMHCSSVRPLDAALDEPLAIILTADRVPVKKLALKAPWPKSGCRGPWTDWRGCVTGLCSSNVVTRIAPRVPFPMLATSLGTRHCLADRLASCRVVLVGLDVGISIARRHQPYFVPELPQLSCPVVCGGARFDADQAGPQPGKELQNLPALQLPATDNLAASLMAWTWNADFGMYNPDCGNLSCGGLLSAVPKHRRWHIAMPAEEPSEASIAVLRVDTLCAQSW